MSRKKQATAEWGYSKKNGPDTWAKCFPDAAGSNQSPIDIRPVFTRVARPPEKLSWRYTPENVVNISNPGCGWKVEYRDEGSELSGGPLKDKYSLRQFHCHWGETNNKGSEHALNGRSFAGELHLVHWNSTRYATYDAATSEPDGFVVLGVFLRIGKKHPELEKLIKYIARILYKDQSTTIDEPIDPSQFLPKSSTYYAYAGSLTTPPCSECVIWIIFKDPMEVSIDQLDAFRNLKTHTKDEDHRPSDEYKGFLKANWRTTMPVNEREVKECRQK